MPPSLRPSETSSFATVESAGETKRSRRVLVEYVFIGLVAMGVLFRLVFVLIPGNALRAPWSGGGDTGAYVLLAQNIVEHRGFTYAGQPTAFRPPGYPMLLARFMKTFGQHYVFATRVLQFFEGLIVALLCAEIARRALGKSAAKAALVVALFLPTLVEMSSEILTEATATVLTVVFLYFLVGYTEDTNWLPAIGMSAAVGLGALVRSNLVFLGFVSVGTILRRSRGRFLWRDFSTAIVIPTVLVAPWLWRNHSAFHRPLVYSTQGGFAAIAGVLLPQGRALPGDADKLRAAIGWGLPTELETNAMSRSSLPAEPEIDRRCWQAALRAWRTVGWRLVALTLRKTSYFWLSTDQIFSIGGFSKTQRLIRVTGVLVYWLVLGLGVVGWLRLRRDKPRLAEVLLMYALLVTVLHTPFNMNTRYRITFMDPLLAVLAANTVLTVATKRLSRKCDSVPASGI
jgi:4-amino-4-deoxy-L-arabinose transferase-like glycosyltransferase